MDKKKPVLPKDQERQIKLQNPSSFYAHVQNIQQPMKLTLNY